MIVDIIALIATLIIGAITEKETNITQYIYYSDSNKTTIEIKKK